MRHGRSAKQRIWLGPGRYRGRRGDAVTNADAESYALTNSYTSSMRGDTVADPDRNSDSNSNSNTNSYSYGDCNSHGDTNAYEYA